MTANLESKPAPLVAWPADVARTMRRNAVAYMTRHDHGPDIDPAEEHDVRANCGACSIRGWAPLTDDAGTEVPPAPNVAGWARVWVQAGRPSPVMFREAFEDERVTADNPAYASALARDILTWGVTFTQPSHVTR